MKVAVKGCTALSISRPALAVAVALCTPACASSTGARPAQSKSSASPSVQPQRSAALVSALQRLSFDDAVSRFDDRLLRAVPPQRLADVWRRATAERGAFLGIQRVRTFPSKAGVVELSTLRFEHGFVDVRASFDPDGRMNSLFIRPADVSEHAIEVVLALTSGHEEEAFTRFSPAMKSALPLPALRGFFEGLRARHGDLRTIEDVPVSADGFDSATVHCVFEKARLDGHVAFDRGQFIVEGVRFLPPPAPPDPAPPPYADPTSYTERDIRIGGGANALPGTLTMPRSTGAVAGAVLVSGSGPHDRDETMAANRPLRDLGLGLATRRIATLRYEKRTYGANALSIPDKSKITIDDDTTNDAVEAVRMLMSTPGVDPSRVFVVGHSQGGMMAPVVAERAPNVAGLVLLAAPARPLEDLILDQQTYLASLAPASYPKEALDEIRRKVARVKAPDLANARAEDLPNRAPPSFWLSLRGYDPAGRALALRKPLLVLQGDRDFQVTDADLAIWKARLAGAPDAKVELLPGLSHILEEGSAPPSPHDYERPGHVSPLVVQEIATFIDAHASDARTR